MGQRTRRAVVTHPTGREAMDLFNNEIGRRIWADNPDASPEELQQIIKSKIESGEVLVMAPKEGNSSSLGSGVRFQYALEDAVKGNQPTNLDRLAQTAGWTGEWDRVVDLFPGVTAEDLERITGITGMCWKSLPTKDSGSEQQYGYYLFLDGNAPVQTIPWTSDIKYLEFGDAGVVRRDAELAPTRGRVTGGRVLAPTG